MSALLQSGQAATGANGAPAFQLRPLTPHLGAEVSGLDLTSDISPDAFAALYAAFLRYQVLVFPPHELAPAAQVALARRFGEVQVHVMSRYHADGFPELYRLSNLDAHGNPNGRHPDKGTLVWHTDGSWRRVTGQATIIYGEIVPESGGETHFCDMYGAWERLDAAWRARIALTMAIRLIGLDGSAPCRFGERRVSAPDQVVSLRSLQASGTSPSTVQRRTTRRCMNGSYGVARCIRQRLSQTISSFAFQRCS